MRRNGPTCVSCLARRRSAATTTAKSCIAQLILARSLYQITEVRGDTPKLARRRGMSADHRRPRACARSRLDVRRSGAWPIRTARGRVFGARPLLLGMAGRRVRLSVSGNEGSEPPECGARPPSPHPAAAVRGSCASCWQPAASPPGLGFSSGRRRVEDVCGEPLRRRPARGSADGRGSVGCDAVVSGLRQRRGAGAQADPRRWVRRSPKRCATTGSM